MYNSRIETRKVIHAKVLEGWNKASLSATALECRDKRANDQQHGESWEDDGNTVEAPTSTHVSNVAGRYKKGVGTRVHRRGMRT